MSLGVIRGGLIALRVMAVLALGCALASGFAPLTDKWRSFLAGMTCGLLLVLTVALFRAPREEVERMPHERDQP